jgi:hypothetical protein
VASEPARDVFRLSAALTPPSLHPSISRLRQLVDARFAALSAAAQQVVMGLCDSTDRAQTGQDGKSLVGIIRSNGYPLGKPSGGTSPPRSALFAVACLFQHSCKPNARVLWREDRQGGRQLAIALRPIAVGEEITVQYKGGLAYAPRAVRRARLLEIFRFHCACIACAQPEGADREASDERRQAMRSLLDEVPKAGFSDPSVLERLLSLMEAEGLDTPLDLGSVHHVAYQLAMRTGDVHAAVAHLREACRCTELCEGAGSQLGAQLEAELTRLRAEDSPIAS